VESNENSNITKYANNSGGSSFIIYNCSSAPSPELDIHVIIYRHVLQVLLLFGIIGNIMNLIILTHRSLKTGMACMEKSVLSGMIALAVSDFLFCLSAFPHTLDEISTQHLSTSVDFVHVYVVCENAIINWFIMSSTWITVGMAVSRYLAICHPFQAERIISVTLTYIVIILIFVFSMVINLPRFWLVSVNDMKCEEGWKCYFQQNGILKQEKRDIVYLQIYFIFAFIIPLVILAYCNVHLVKEIYRSTQRDRHTNGRDSDPGGKFVVTLTLLIIVVFHVIFVGPSEVANFWKESVMAGELYSSYDIGTDVCNILQSVNFAMNFVLYAVINVKFRRVIREIICGTYFSASHTSHENNIPL
jgi:hypothetical protein